MGFGKFWKKLKDYQFLRENISTMKRVALICLFLSLFAWADNQPVVFSKTTVRGTGLNLVTIDLNSDAVEIRPILAPPGSALSFQSLLYQGGSPYTAVTGTFFDPATAITVGNVVHNGRLMTEGSVGSVMSIDQKGRASVRSLEGKMGRHINWDDTKFAISAGPTLITNGELTVAPRAEGFRDGGLWGARMRVAMGVTPENKLLLITTREPVGLHELGRIFQDLGAVDAVNLDGGSSSAMYHNGQVVTRPGRRLTNLIAIYAKGAAPDQSRALGDQYARAYSHYIKGTKLYKQGSYRLAHSQVRKALSMAPDRPPYWQTLGEIQESSRELQKAAESYLRAAELYYERSQEELARICAQAAFRLAPELRESYPELNQLAANV